MLFALGMIVGCILGVLVTALCVSAAKGNKDDIQ
jgi:hypothetical protein